MYHGVFDGAEFIFIIFILHLPFPGNYYYFYFAFTLQGVAYRGAVSWGGGVEGKFMQNQQKCYFCLKRMYQGVFDGAELIFTTFQSGSPFIKDT